MMRANLHVRPAQASDLVAILGLERATEEAPHWTPATYTAIFNGKSPQRCLFLAEYKGALAGFAVGLVHPTFNDAEDARAELETVLTALDARRLGIGRILCETVINWCRSQGAMELFLEVRSASFGAIALYAGLGFEQIGRRPRYYRSPEDDAILMKLRLNGAEPEKRSSNL